MWLPEFLHRILLPLYLIRVDKETGQPVRNKYSNLSNRAAYLGLDERVPFVKCRKVYSPFCLLNEGLALLIIEMGVETFADQAKFNEKYA